MANPTNEAEILHSWKEIANFLGKGVRTVQRWECSLGLPVLRCGSRTRDVVARRSDLQAWISKVFVPVERLSGAAGCALELRQGRMKTRRLVHEEASLLRDIEEQVRRFSAELQRMEWDSKGQRKPK